MSDSKHTWPEFAPVIPYFSEARPTLGPDRPSILRPDGSPFNVVLPSLMLTPEPSGALTLWGFFPMDGQSSSPKFATFPNWDALASAYSRWLACPEKFAVEELGWWPRSEAPARVQNFSPKSLKVGVGEISLEDLM